MRNDKLQAEDTAKASRQPRRMQPVRLPQATADLVNRLLAARCGTSRFGEHAASL